MRVRYDWLTDEVPDLAPPVHASVSCGCNGCLDLASSHAKRSARRFHKSRVNRLQRRAVKELLATGVEPRSLGVTFTCWDII